MMQRCFHKMATTVFCIFYSSIILATGGTGVGSGGDIIDLYLKATRQALINAVDHIEKHPENDTSLCRCIRPNTHVYCQFIKTLTEDQVGFCQGVLKSSVQQIKSLTQGLGATDFDLATDPLYVTDPEGQSRRVKAKTLLGQVGPITFHYDSIQAISASELLSIMAHEFFHKVSFQNGFIDDNPPIGPFSERGGGRYLLDSIGAAITLYALDQGLIGEELEIRDQYRCSIKMSNGPQFSSHGESVRRFLKSDSLKMYETSVSLWPRDFTCALDESNTTQVVFRLTIHEPDDCKPEAAENRYTRLELWRVSSDRDELGISQQPELIEQKDLIRFNPLCMENPREPFLMNYSDSQHQFQFKINYEGSIGAN